MTAEETRPRRSGLAKLRGAPVESPPDADLSPPLRDDVASTTDVVPPETEAVLSVAPEAPEQAPSDAPPGRARRNGPVAGLAAMVVAIVVLLGFVIALHNRLSSHQASGISGGSSSSSSDDSARFAALQAGRQFAVSFFTYDYRKLPDYFQRIQDASTGSFRSDFISKESTLKTVVTELKTVATGQVPDFGAGVYSEGGGKAVVFVAANLNASNAVTKNGQQRYRVKLQLQLVKGSWLVNDFSEVS